MDAKEKAAPGADLGGPQNTVLGRRGEADLIPTLAPEQVTARARMLLAAGVPRGYIRCYLEWAGAHPDEHLPRALQLALGALLTAAPLQKAHQVAAEVEEMTT